MRFARLLALGIACAVVLPLLAVAAALNNQDAEDVTSTTNERNER